MMSRRAYYEDLLALANEKRALHCVDTSRFGLQQVRNVYKAEEIRLDYWPLPRKIKAIYMCDGGDCSVAVQRALPDEPKLFALVHELKHHYRDQKILNAGRIVCGDYNANEQIEKGAEVFAAEFIYPIEEFNSDLSAMNVSNWTAEDIVRFKKQGCRAKVSYTFLCKRLTWLRHIAPGQFTNVQFQKLQDKMFGVPVYRRMRH